MGETDYSGQMLDDRYEILRLLGSGGMGTVYLGRHRLIDREVAIKFLRAELAGSEEIVTRFYREARAAAMIRHRNIIDVLDVGVAPWGDPFLVMEYLEGESLASMLRRTGPLDLAAACGIMEAVLSGLLAAHEKGIIHRDLKPDNIFIVHQRGEKPLVKIIDFGISKVTREVDQTKLTQTGSMLGTPAYMSPEQARGISTVDHRADLYSMGVIFYEMLTGQLPFTGANYNDLIINLLTKEPRKPSQVFPRFPFEAEPAVMRALCRDPADRYQSCNEMLSALRGMSGFDTRIDQLARTASSITKTSFAAGDLGARLERESDGVVAADVLSKVAREETPKTWIRNTTARYKRRVMYLGLVLAAAVVFTVLGFLVSNGDEDMQLPPAAEEQNVLVLVEGVPAGAVIFWNDTFVPRNPFRVKKQQINVPLRVENDGQVAFKTMVLPSEDRVIDISLEHGATIPLTARPEDIVTGFHLETEPTGATVWINDRKYRETTPIQLTDLEPGKYIVRLTKGDKYTEQRFEIEVSRGQLKKLPRKTLQLSKVEVFFNTEPAGAKTTLISNGRRMEIGPTPVSAILETSEQYDVEFSKWGYKQYSGEVEYEKDVEQSNLKTVKLKKAKIPSLQKERSKQKLSDDPLGGIEL